MLIKISQAASHGTPKQLRIRKLEPSSQFLSILPSQPATLNMEPMSQDLFNALIGVGH